MKKTYVALFLAQTILACGVGGSTDEKKIEDAPLAEPPRVDGPVTPTPEPIIDYTEFGTTGTPQELIAALAKGDRPEFVIVRAGTKLDDGSVIRAEDQNIARAVRMEGAATVVVEVVRDGTTTDAKVALADVTYLKKLALARIGLEVDRATTVGVGELDDFEIDEAARRATPMGIVPALGKEFDCIARFAKISASRDFTPYPLTNCAAPQDPVGDPERIADATKARAVAQNLFNKMVTEYNNAQAMLASLRARSVAILNAYVFIRNDPYFKEYNVTHFKDFIHGRKSYNDRYERAEQLLIAASLATQAQIEAYSQVPPPSPITARAEANVIVARKWGCVLRTGLLNNGGRSGTDIVGVSLETAGAPFVDIQIMLDDHPPLPQSDKWGGLFGVNATPALASDVTRLAVADIVPVRASVGLPIAMIRFQPLDAKKTRPVGKACNLRAGIVP